MSSSTDQSTPTPQPITFAKQAYTAARGWIIAHPKVTAGIAVVIILIVILTNIGGGPAQAKRVSVTLNPGGPSKVVCPTGDLSYKMSVSPASRQLVYNGPNTYAVTIATSANFASTSSPDLRVKAVPLDSNAKYYVDTVRIDKPMTTSTGVPVVRQDDWKAPARKSDVILKNADLGLTDSVLICVTDGRPR